MGIIIGNVENRSTGKPLSGVSVDFIGSTASTDSSGNYRITSFPMASGPLTFSKSGFQTQSANISAPGSKDPDVIRGASLVPIQEPEPEIIKERVMIEPTPTDAKVAVSGQSPVTGKFDKYLETGNYSYSVTKPGYISLGNFFTVRQGTSIFIKPVLEIEPAPTPPEPELTWWEKALIVLEKLTSINFIPFLRTDPLMKTIQDAIIKKANRENYDIPEWVWESGLAVFLLDLEDFTDSEVMMGTLPLTPAGNFYSLLKSNSFPNVLDYMKAHRIESIKGFKNLNDLTKAQILKGLSKDKLARSFVLELEQSNNAYMKSLDSSLWTKISGALRDPKTLNFSIGRIITFLATLAGTQFGLEWAVKEGIIEPMVFPFTQELSAYRFDPTPERLELITSMLERIEDKVPKATAIMNALGWIFPFLKPLWDEIAGTYDNQIEDFRKELEIVEPPEAKGTLIIRPDPTDAKVSVEGEIPTTGIFSADLNVGVYSFTVSKFGYLSFTGTAEIQEGLTTEANIELGEEIEPPIPPEEQKGNLIISVMPNDAKIEVSGQPEITGPGAYDLFQGFYTLRVSKEGYETQITTSYVRSKEDTRASFVLKEIIVPPEISIIRVESIPIGATIFIDGETTFNITNTSLQVQPGAHTLTLKKKDFIDEEIEFEIKEGESLLFNLTLIAIPKPPIPAKATITITSEPTDADIYIDGQYTFTTTPYTVLLDSGIYYIRVQKEGYYPVEVQAEIEEGETAEIPFALELIPSDQIPVDPYIPYDPVYPDGYEPLYPEPYAPGFYQESEPSAEKELLINIETTDVKPWNGRIYSIAFQDLSVPGIEPVVLMGDNEQYLINEFLNLFNQINPSKLIGFKLAFDHRFIFHKIMNYRMQSEKWANIKQSDVKQLMDQVQEEFVYFPDKTGTLDDYGKSLLGKGKYGAQADMLKQYLAKNWDYVKAFQERQLEITNGLYQLFRFSSSGSSSAPISTPSTSNPIPETFLSPIPLSQPGQKQCSNCLAFNPSTATQCEVCGSTMFK